MRIGQQMTNNLLHEYVTQLREKNGMATSCQSKKRKKNYDILRNEP